MNIWIFDSEVFAYDYLFKFKKLDEEEWVTTWNTKEPITELLNDEDTVLCGFNNKHYDQYILKAILGDATAEEVKEVNDLIINDGVQGFDIPICNRARIKLKQFDLADDIQIGTSLKSYEGHSGFDIRESKISFDIDRPLTDEEREEVERYCETDVINTERLYHEREDYLNNKIMLGRLKGIEDYESLYMTNAKLTAAFLNASPIETNDEREYVFPTNVLWEYIPPEVYEFFDRIHNKSIPDDELWKSSLEFYIGDMLVKIGWGGVHGALSCYIEEATTGRLLLNDDVSSLYPSLIIIMGYFSRAMKNPQDYIDVKNWRIEAKKNGDKKLSNALKLVINTYFGAMLNKFNALYDPLMARSTCITGQLYLIELANHLQTECKTLKSIQLNTDGYMYSIDESELHIARAILDEWQTRTGLELEEDKIFKIVQKDVSNYIEVQLDGSTKVKGSWLVRGVAPAGAFKINNNYNCIPKAIIEYFVNGVSVEETIETNNNVFDYQIIAKASHKYKEVFHSICGKSKTVQKCNRVYAVDHPTIGTLYKVSKEDGQISKIADLPEHCVCDNANEITIEEIDKSWYVRKANEQIFKIIGAVKPKKNTRKINSIKKEILNLLEAI